MTKLAGSPNIKKKRAPIRLSARQVARVRKMLNTLFEAILIFKKHGLIYHWDGVSILTKDGLDMASLEFLISQSIGGFAGCECAREVKFIEMKNGDVKIHFKSEFLCCKSVHTIELLLRDKIVASNFFLESQQ